MLKRVVMGSAVVALVATLGAPLLAEDCGELCDTTLRQGRVFDTAPSVVVYGSGDSELVRTWIPFLLDDETALLNNSLCRIVEGRILGAVTTYSMDPMAVVLFGTADLYDDVGTYTSNDIVVLEDAGCSDTVGQMLADGSLIWRANYCGSTQNNLEWELCHAGQQTPVQEPNAGQKILQGPGIDGTTGNAYLSTPGAEANGDRIYVGNSNFDGFTGDIPRGVNIWDYDPGVGPSSSQLPDYTYLQSAAETFANANGVPCDPGDGRQTQPFLKKVGDVHYVVFGINDTNNGGSGRPAMFAVDAFEDNDGFVGAIPIVADSGWRFIDHQANGGGSNVYENSHFDMNASGDIVALTESWDPNDPNAPQDPNDVPTYQVVLYRAITSGGRITGYQDPVIIADAGPLETRPEDELVGPYGYYFDPNDPGTWNWDNAISGVGINDCGNVAFVGLYDTDEPFDPNDPNSATRWDDAVYFYKAGTDTLHQVLRENDMIVYTNQAGTEEVKLALGPIAREDGDAFMGANLADDADVLAVNFRSNRNQLEGFSRGVAVVAVGHVGDVDFDYQVKLGDLAALLGAYNSTLGTPSYDSQCDFDLDGDVDLGDLAELLGSYNSNYCP